MSNDTETIATPLPVPRRRWIRDVCLGLTIFLSGVLVGAGAIVHFHRTHPFPVMSALEKGRPFPLLKRALNLSEEQAPKVQAIIAKGLGDLKDLRRAVRPQAEVIVERVRIDVEKELNEQQKRKWNRQFNQIRQRWLPPNPERGPRGAIPEGDSK